MKIKSLRSIAKSIANMAASSRMTSSFDEILSNDIEMISIDLLLGEVNPDKEMLPIVTDLHNWFMDQLQKESISKSDIESATLQISLDYKSVATDLDKVALFHLNNHVNISGNGRSIEASAFNKIWHARGSA